MLEVEAADLCDRVHEPVEDARRSGRKEQEGRLGTEVGDEARALELVVAGVASSIQEHGPADREAHVEDGVPEIEAVHHPRQAEERPLHSGFEVQVQPLLERDDPLSIPPRPLAAVAAEHALPHEQVDRVHQEAERELSSHRGRHGA